MVVIRVKGAMDRKDIPSAEEGAMSLIDHGYLHLVVDLSETESVSSTGLGLILYYQTMLKKKRGSMVLVRPRGAPAGTLKLLKLDKVLSICDSLEEALQLARSAAGRRKQGSESV